MTERDSGDSPDLAALDAQLRRAKFAPRESLGPELLGKVRRGEQPRDAPRTRWGWLALRTLAIPAGAVVLALSAMLSLAGHRAEVTLDRCCFDFDGGGATDDGITIVSRRGEEVRRLAVYEDRDGSGSYSQADEIRFTRGPEPTVQGPLPAGLVTSWICCTDYDGGGPADDGVIVVGIPPDRVMMVTLYEQPLGSPGRHTSRIR